MHQIFRVGDRVIFKKTGFVGYVTDVEFNPLYNDYRYSVQKPEYSDVHDDNIEEQAAWQWELELHPEKPSVNVSMDSSDNGDYTAFSIVSMTKGFNPENHTIAINQFLKDLSKEKQIHMDQISDSYHTFSELYMHRMALTVVVTRLIDHLVNTCDVYYDVYRSLLHYDGTMYENMFIVVIRNPETGKQMSYHYELEFWDMFDHIETRPQADPYDGHTSEDTIQFLLKNLGGKE